MPIFDPPSSLKHPIGPSSSQPPHPPPPPKTTVPQPSPEPSQHPFIVSPLPSPKLPPSPPTSPFVHSFSYTSSSSHFTPLSKPKPSAPSLSTPTVILESPSPPSSLHPVPSKPSSPVSSSHTIPLNQTSSPQPTLPIKPIHISLSPSLRIFGKKVPIRRKSHSTIPSPSPPITISVLFPTILVFPSTMPSSTTSSSIYKPPSTTDFVSTPPHLTPPTLSPPPLHSIPPDPSLASSSDLYYPLKR